MSENYEIRENSGTIFKNEAKKSDAHSDYSGKVRIGGVDYYISLWVKEGKTGKKFFGAGFKPINASAEVKVEEKTSKPDKDDDLLPF